MSGGGPEQRHVVGGELRDEVVDIVRRAGALVLEVYETDFEVRDKDDSSPVTRADEECEALIVPALRALDPGTPVVAEEEVAAGRLPDVRDRFWLVDPLDGTKEFISRNGEFTVNVALVVAGEPVLGVVLAPALDRLYAGSPGEAFVEAAGQRRAIACRPVPDAGLTVVASRSHGDPDALARFLEGVTIAAERSAGSSLKLCLVAEGSADLYPRLGRTMEWDIAAGDAVLRAAGGVTSTLDGELLAYGKPDFANPHFMAASRDAARRLRRA